MSLRPELLEVLICPRCGGDLVYREEMNALDCDACRLRYEIDDDIPVMNPEEARPLDGH